MEKQIKKYVLDLIKRYPLLEKCEVQILKAFELLKDTFENGQKLLICGNGGSASDANHIAGELMKAFKLERKCSGNLTKKIIELDSNNGKDLIGKLQCGLPVIALDNHTSLNTAFINDVENGGLYIFAQQTFVYGQAGDALLCISTSGNSKNIICASVVAKAKNMKTIALTGSDGGKLKKFSDVAIIVPEFETYIIQEYHVPIYHCLCLMLEDYFFGKETT